MSKHVTIRRKTILDIQKLKGNMPVVVLTAYTAPMARLLDEHVDILVVGDSLGMVLYGMESTLPVSLDIMIAHGRAVVNASKSAMVVVHMPFGSYQGSKEAAFNSCARVLKETSCHAVKIEGGAEIADTIKFLTERGIPVMGHIALMPQHVNTLGGYRYQGRTEEERKKLLRDAIAIDKAGAFTMVIECAEENISHEIYQKVSLCTIGIGASPRCDGQVLVSEDMLGLTDVAPKFVKHYIDLGGAVSKAAASYAADVRKGKFPTLAHCFTTK